jgi:hypothetical protein
MEEERPSVTALGVASMRALHQAHDMIRKSLKTRFPRVWLIRKANSLKRILSSAASSA